MRTQYFYKHNNSSLYYELSLMLMMCLQLWRDNSRLSVLKSQHQFRLCAPRGIKMREDKSSFLSMTGICVHYIHTMGVRNIDSRRFPLRTYIHTSHNNHEKLKILTDNGCTRKYNLHRVYTEDNGCCGVYAYNQIRHREQLWEVGKIDGF